MNNLLSRLFRARNITDVTELSSEERDNFDNWKRVLSEEEVTIEDVSKFCDRQKQEIEILLENTDNSYQKNERLIYQLGIYRKIAKLITGRKTEREALEQYLEDLIRKA